MSKSFANAPKPPALSADVITRFERGGSGQDTQNNIPSNVEKRETTKVDKGEEKTRRLSIDLPASLHRRFKTACSRADKKMVVEDMDFSQRRTEELEQD